MKYSNNHQNMFKLFHLLNFVVIHFYAEVALFEVFFCVG